MSQKSLKIQDLSYKEILTQVNFEWSQGEKVALMGANGSGKSTLARLLAGLINPTAGEVSLYEMGERVSWEGLKRWQEIALVGQHPRRQTIGATVAEELGFSLINSGYSPAEVKSRVRELAQKIGLGKYLSQSPSTLSGGERQRLTLAAILAMNPSFLILDESLTMLDQKMQEIILTMIEASKPLGQLWITHDPKLAVKADRLLLMKGGKLTHGNFSPQEALKSPAFCKEYGIRSLVSVYSFNMESNTILDKEKIKETLGVYAEITCQVKFRENSPVLLHWEDVRYENRVYIQQSVRRGEFIGITGPSGAGKTTILEGVTGLRVPIQGKLFIEGKAFQSWDIREIRKKIRLLQQEAGDYLIGRTVMDEVFFTLPQKARKKYREEHSQFIQSFGIPEEKVQYSPERLSGGERQRVALAAAMQPTPSHTNPLQSAPLDTNPLQGTPLQSSIGTTPEVLLLDEPLIGLDATGREIFLTLLQGFKERHTIFYVTHDVEEIIHFLDRLWVVEEGLVREVNPQEWVQGERRV